MNRKRTFLPLVPNFFFDLDHSTVLQFRVTFFFKEYSFLVLLLVNKFYLHTLDSKVHYKNGFSRVEKCFCCALFCHSALHKHTLPPTFYLRRILYKIHGCTWKRNAKFEKKLSSWHTYYVSFSKIRYLHFTFTAFLLFM